MNYYNEWDAKTAAWLRELIAHGHLPPGDVDTRSITEIQPHELHGYTQCHFFAGIGGWSLALRLAGWPDDLPVWTGSCPCQPYSAAGKRKGDADERNLWPEFRRLIRECRPVRIFGEQVASAIGAGWLDGVSADLEAESYACGAVVLGAHSVGAPHRRQRLFWGAARLGDACGAGSQRHGQPGCEHAPEGRHAEGRHASEAGVDCGLGDTCGAGGVADADGSRQRTSERSVCDERNDACWGSPWSNYVLLPCTDGKSRRAEPGVAPLAHGLPARVVRLRGYGNAIVPQVAAAFIEEFEESVASSNSLRLMNPPA